MTILLKGYSVKNGLLCVIARSTRRGNLICSMEKHGFVYILSNTRHTVLYGGVTSNLPVRISQHKEGKGSIVARRYCVDQLVYYEVCDTIEAAINREKQLKAGSRAKKEKCIRSINPEWHDLSKML